MSCQCSHCRSYKAEQRDGTGRFNRMIKALDPSSVKLDERGLEDLLVFLQHYANQIRYHPTPTENTGEVLTWETFFEQDKAVLLASILVADTEQEEQNYLKTREKLYANPNINDFKNLFIHTLEIAKKLDDWLFLAQSRQKMALQTELELLIRSNLAGQLLKLFQYAKGVETPRQEEIELIFSPKAKDIWNHNPKEILGDSSIYYAHRKEDEPEEEDDEDPDSSRLINASWYIDDVFQSFKTGMDSIIAKSQNFFESQLTEHPDHQPHMALLMAFLQLFKFLQNDLNQLPKRHLDFFYQEVLQLQPQAAHPDQVYAVFELAKGVADYLVLPNTAVNAGNDALGVERIYHTSEDMPLVINRAQVAQLKNLFLHEDETSGVISHFFANPVANSADGLGLPFKDPNASFDTFGVGGRDEKINLTLCNYRKQQQLFGHPARLGLAIASPQLVLGGGTRTIELEIEGLKNLIKAQREAGAPESVDLTTLFGFWLTGEKGWLPPVKDSITKVFVRKDVNDNKELDPAKIIITLDSNFPKIIPFDPALHPGDNFNTKNPILKIEFKTLSEVDYTKTLVLDTTFKLTTNVKGLKDLVLQNSLQRVENGKTFPLFTLMPATDAPFYIGSKEFFSKKISTFQLNVFSKGIALASASAHSLSVWNTTEWTLISNKIGTRDTFKDTASPTPAAIEIRRKNKLIEAEFSNSASNGFFRASLNGSITTVNQSAAAGLQHQADTISIDYDSTLSFSDLIPGIDQFFHLYPFGILESFPTKNSADRQRMEGLTGGQFVDTQVPSSDAAPRWYLLPQFFFGNRYDVNVLSGARTQYNQLALQNGHLFIGVKDVLPLQTLSLLFQFEEGSQAEDEIPGALHWSYLSDNAWKPLSSDRVLSDTSYGLQTTGIVIFDLPGDVSTQHTLMPADLVWLCASVDAEPDRFPRLISVQAQAALLTYEDRQNDPDHYRDALPAGSITQLEERVAEVKSLKQPYPSFGAVPTQQGLDFYIAASERIRHKGRAVTIWDYEHLVLGRFPEIFKVKALPYLDPRCLCREESKLKKCPPSSGTTTSAHDGCCDGPQEAPGNVLLVAIPNVRQRVGNRLQPKNSNRVLRGIEDYLRPRTNPFTTVQVKNPEYEEVLTSFRVQFKEGFDKGKFLRILNEDLVRFLTPWAFETETAQADIRFDQRIYASEIINFIEERKYVDFITDFFLFHCHEDCCGKGKGQELVTVTGSITLADITGIDKSKIPISIQLLGTNIETNIHSGAPFTLLATEGMSLLIKAEKYVTRVIVSKKNTADPKVLDWFDAFDDTPVTKNATGLDISLQADDAAVHSINAVSTLAPTTVLKTLTLTPNIELILEHPDYLPKKIISKSTTQTIKLMPIEIPKLTIEIKDAKNLQEVMINVLGNPDQSFVKDETTHLFTIDKVKTGSQLLIRAKNHVPRVVFVEEDTLEITTAPALTVKLTTELLPDQTHCLKTCDDLIEFWENIRNTYLPGLNGAEIAVAPSNPRAILVSTEQHWIELYQAPEVVDPCTPKPEGKTNTPSSSTPGSTTVGGGTTGSEPGRPPRAKDPYRYGGTLYVDERIRLYYEKWLNFQELRMTIETFNKVPGVVDPIDVVRVQSEVSSFVNPKGTAAPFLGLEQDRRQLEETLVLKGPSVFVVSPAEILTYDPIFNPSMPLNPFHSGGLTIGFAPIVMT